MLRFGLIPLFITASAMSLASNTQDVIYKKDGSILKGTLIEQDFQNGHYKIQLMGGSIFVIQKDDIEKITKEESSLTETESELNAVATESRAKLQTSSNEQSFPAYPAAHANQTNRTKNNPIKHILKIGTMSKVLMDESESGSVYTGLGLSYQYNFNKNFAAYSALNLGSIKNDLEDGNEIDASDSDEKFRQIQAAAIVSTNNYQGWQFYTGLGLFTETYSSSSTDFSDSYTGSNLHFGFGYSGKTLQGHLRFTVDESGDYQEGFSGSTANLQLGINF